jgi:surface antigen
MYHQGASMPTARAQYLIAVAMGVACMYGGAPFAGNLTRDMPMGFLDKNDWQMVRDAITEVVESTTSGQKREWKNTQNGHSGTVMSLRAFRSDGRDCHLIQIDNSAAGRSSSSRYNVCRGTDGVWRDSSSGAPFTAKPPRSPGD